MKPLPLKFLGCLFISVTLAACGGSGGPDMTETPETDNSEALTPDVEIPDDEIPEVPVADPIVLDLGTEVTFDAAAGTFQMGEVSWDRNDPRARIRYEGGTDGETLAAQFLVLDTDETGREVHTGTVFFNSISQGDAYVISSVLVESGGGRGEGRLEGRSLFVPSLTSVPSGSATFTGEYLGATFLIGEGGQYGFQRGYEIYGRAEMTAIFGNSIEETVLEGGVYDRILLSTVGDETSPRRRTNQFNDIEFSGITVGDDGVFQGGLSGGETKNFNADGDVVGFVLQTVEGDISGQIGGDGDVIAATVATTAAITGVSGVSDIDVASWSVVERGAFIATSP